MRLSKNQAPRTLPYPVRTKPKSRHRLSEARSTESLVSRYQTSSNLRATADLLDLVAGRRADLVKILLEIFGEAPSVRAHAEELQDLITICGVSEGVSPCATAMAIAADLEQLVGSADRWTHPAQIVRDPSSMALSRLCAARIERAKGPVRENLVQILPRLERAARLAEKAASRRVQGASRQPKRVDRWL